MAVAGSKMASSLRRAAGQVLIVGLEGTTLSAAERAWLRLIQPGGVILFRRNVETARQTHALLEAATEAAKASPSAPLLRCMDVEGGTVDRLRDLLAPMPSVEAVAAARDPRLFTEHGRLIGLEMRALGLNVDFAPVLDLKTSSSAPVMGSRVHSGSPEEVINYASHFLQGLMKEGVLGCGKHFPGLGGGAVDSHHATPLIDKSFESLWKEDLLPYRELAFRLPLVMVSHAAYPRTASRNKPASISPFWIRKTLLKKIGFRGLVVSDDMEMGGILSQTDIADATLRALLAGTHLIEICHDSALILAAYEALLSEAEHSPAFARCLRRTAAAAESFKHKRLGKRHRPQTPSAAAVSRARAAIQHFADKLRESAAAAERREEGIR